MLKRHMKFSKTRIHSAVCFLIYVAFCALSRECVFAQSSPSTLTEQDRLLEDELVRELEGIKETIIEPSLPPEKKLSISYGGWITSIFRDYTDTDNDKNQGDSVSLSWLHEIRLWTKMTYKKKQNIFLRIKNTYIDRKCSTVNDTTKTGDDYEGPALDIGYLATQQSFFKKPMVILLGRQYLYVGRGIVFRDIYDGIKIILDTPKFFYKGFITHTLPHEQNIDTSQPEYEQEGERMFYGLEVGYLGVPKGVAYGYYVMQRDLSQSNFAGDSQTYRYDSEYIGLGMEGSFGKVEYAAEFIRQFGTSYSDVSEGPELNEGRDINAWAANLRLRWQMQIVSHPLLEAEYAYGSGDKDRTSVVDTKYGGNIYGDDENFLYFGTYYAGYALSPRLSNIHIYRLHFACSPFEKIPSIKDMVVGLKYYFYRKDKASGGIYDDEATADKKDIGHEVNGYTYWKVNKHFSWTFRYGIFFPSEAYPDATNNNTRYLFSRLTYTF